MFGKLSIDKFTRSHFSTFNLEKEYDAVPTDALTNKDRRLLWRSMMTSGRNSLTWLITDLRSSSKKNTPFKLGFATTRSAYVRLVKKRISALGCAFRKDRTTGDVSTISPMELNRMIRMRCTKSKCRCRRSLHRTF